MPAPRKRFRAPALQWYDIADLFWVKCPECDQAASIELPTALNTQKAIAKCTSCFWHTHYEKRLRYEPTANGLCTICSAKLESSSISLTQPNHCTYIQCQKCKSANKVLRWTQTFKKYGNGEATDPIFGLPLYFATSVSGQIFWIINRKHLEILLDYLEASLRQKPLASYHMTIVEKLPKFVVEANNRHKLVPILKEWKEIMLEKKM